MYFNTELVSQVWFEKCYYVSHISCKEAQTKFFLYEKIEAVTCDNYYHQIIIIIIIN